MTLGTVLLAAGLLAALAGVVAAILVIRGDRDVMSWARGAAGVSLAMATAASLLLLGLIVTKHYEVAYIYEYTSNTLPLSYRISAFWAGQQGSFLLWLLLSSILTVLQIRRARQFEPYVLAFLLLVQAGLSLFLLVDSPFRLGQAAADGYGMNPLLQNPWMVSHPPMLFIGYAGLAVPFAYALAGLWRRDYDEWVRHALPWTLVGWFFLGLGILLGAYWAYETLGWGGYWGWDLVENSSLIPWLTGTALLHGLLIQRYRKRLRHTNFLLATFTFLLVLYATYLTRSGVLAEISTHSFVESGLTPWMVGLLAVFLAMSLALLISRWTDIPRGPIFAEKGQEQKPLLEGDMAGTVGKEPGSWFSRDFTFLLTIVAVLAMTVFVWFGTLVPLFTRINGKADALDTSFYPVTTAPGLLLLLAVLCFCPLLGWPGTAWERLRRWLIAPLAAAVVLTVVAVLIGAHQPLSLLFIFLSVFALTANIVAIVRSARQGILHLGGYLSHVGLGLLVVGIIASTVYAQDGTPLALQPGQAQESLGYNWTFLGWQEAPGEHPALRLQAEKAGESFIALPQLYNNPQDQSLMATPYVRHYITHDIYVAAESYESGSSNESTAIGEGQTVAVDGYTMTLRSLLPAGPHATAILDMVAPNQQQSTVTVTYPLTGTDIPAESFFLPDGGQGYLTQIYAVPAGQLTLVEGTAIKAGPYSFTLQDFSMRAHEQATETIEAGIVLQVAGPEGTQVVTATELVRGADVTPVPVQIAPGVTVSLVGMAVEQRMAMVRVDGVQVERQPGMVWVQANPPEVNSGIARVRVSVKPGMDLLWSGGILLLFGTALATVRRWREKTAK